MLALLHKNRSFPSPPISTELYYKDQNFNLYLCMHILCSMSSKCEQIGSKSAFFPTCGHTAVWGVMGVARIHVEGKRC